MCHIRSRERCRPPRRVSESGAREAMKVVVVGLGYVGAVTAACLAELGHTVVGVDVDQQKAQEIEEGLSPIVEPKLDELVANGRTSGRLRATATLDGAVKDCDAVIVCVG